MITYYKIAPLAPDVCPGLLPVVFKVFTHIRERVKIAQITLNGIIFPTLQTNQTTISKLRRVTHKFHSRFRQSRFKIGARFSQTES